MPAVRAIPITMNMSDIPPLASADLAEGHGVAVQIREQSVFVCRSGGQLYAVANRCPHASSRFEGGKLRDGVITCPLHGAKFRLSTGECLYRSLGYAPLRTFPVREVDGKVLIDLSP